MKIHFVMIAASLAVPTVALAQEIAPQTPCGLAVASGESLVPVIEATWLEMDRESMAQLAQDKAAGLESLDVGGSEVPEYPILVLSSPKYMLAAIHDCLTEPDVAVGGAAAFVYMEGADGKGFP